MRKVAVVSIIVVVGILVWAIGSRLSADAVGMAVGMTFGVLAGVPTALLVMAGGRRHSDTEEQEEEMEHWAPQRLAQGGYGYPPPYQPPVIVLAAPQAQAPWSSGSTVDSVGYPVRQALPGPGAPNAPGGRAFKVVGEKEEWVDEW